jgi:hypothetical protein
LFGIEFFYSFTCGKARKSSFNVYSDSALLTRRQCAGIIVLAFGIWYLGFGTRWISWYKGGDDGNQSKSFGQHVITGVQVSPILTQAHVRLAL